MEEKKKNNLEEISNEDYEKVIYPNTLIYKEKRGNSLNSYWYEKDIIDECDLNGFFNHPEIKDGERILKIGYGGKYPNPEFYLDFQKFLKFGKPTELIVKTKKHYFIQSKNSKFLN